MSFWQILGRLAVSSEGETIQRVSDTNSVSSDGSTRMGSSATGIGAVFNNLSDDFGIGSSKSKKDFDDF